MKKLLVLVLLFISIIAIEGNGVSASVNELAEIDGGIGVYVQTEPVMQTVKVYISEDMVSAVEATNTTVITESTRHQILWHVWYTYEYYYYVDQFVDEVVEERVLTNDIDSLIFVIQELEGFASEYSQCDNEDINDCVLSYVRGINKGYVGGGSGVSAAQWYAAMGGINTGFIDYVDSQDGTELEIAEFFSAFIPYDSYNEDDYGIDDGYSYFSYDDNQFRNMNLGLEDPFNNGGYIDLIHMFASMDGIYNDSSQLVYTPNMSSWAGDLQTFASHLTEENINLSLIDNEMSSWHIYTNYSEDFCDIINSSDCTFSDRDMLADVDAMNIIQGFVNNEIVCVEGYCYNEDFNTISGALSGYYNIIHHDNSSFSNRYKMFLTTVNMSSGVIQSSNLYSEFEDEIYDKMYIKKNSDGTISDRGYLISCEATRLCDDSNIKASFTDRKKAAELFYNYIIYMSSKPYYS